MERRPALIQQSIGRLVEGHDLSPDEVSGSLEEIIDGKALLPR